MQELPLKPFVFGVVFASIFWILGVFAFNLETRIPDYDRLGERYQVYEYSVTENQRLFDGENQSTILWTPGNPRVKVIAVTEIEKDAWRVVLKKTY